MRSLEEYMRMQYRLELIQDHEEGGYAARFPNLPGCITVGETIEETIQNAKEAKRVWLEAALQDGVDIPIPNGSNTDQEQELIRHGDVCKNHYFA